MRPKFKKKEKKKSYYPGQCLAKPILNNCRCVEPIDSLGLKVKHVFDKMQRAR